MNKKWKAFFLFGCFLFLILCVDVGFKKWQCRTWSLSCKRSFQNNRFFLVCDSTCIFISKLGQSASSELALFFSFFVCCLFHFTTLFSFAVFFIHNFLFQDRLKKLKSQHGTVPVGNITVDMVCILKESRRHSQLIYIIHSTIWNIFERYSVEWEGWLVYSGKPHCLMQKRYAYIYFCS